MRIVDLQVQAQTVSGQAQNARAQWSERTGWVVRLKTATGAVGMGEAAPLPGYSPDEPEAVQAFLQNWAGSTVILEPDGVRVWPVLAENTPPSAAYALEQAVLTAAAQEQGLSLREVLGGLPGRGVPVQALLDEPRTAASRARDALQQGIRAFKLKVRGDKDLAEQLWSYREATEQAARICGMDSRRFLIRLDGNGTLSPGFDAVVKTVFPWVDWVEEPRPLPALEERSAVPWALDESLSLFDPTRWEAPVELLAGCVLKPTVLGGLRRCLQWAELARRLGLRLCVSHCYETGPAYWGAVDLAAALHRDGEVHGLYPHSFLKAQISCRAGCVFGLEEAGSSDMVTLDLMGSRAGG